MVLLWQLKHSVHYPLNPFQQMYDFKRVYNIIKMEMQLKPILCHIKLFMHSLHAKDSDILLLMLSVYAKE